MDGNESFETALAHLAMILLASKGEYSPKRGEMDKRHAAVVAFMRTGQCVASEDDIRIAEELREAARRAAA